MMGLQAELRDASDVMVNFAKLGGPQTTNATTTTTTRYILLGRSYIALSSGCELFLKYVTRASLDTPHFQQCKSQVLERGTRFAELALMSRSRIAQIGCSFVNDGSVILTHGRSSVVESLLVRAALVEKKRFKVFVLEGRPDAGGIKSAKSYTNAGIPTTVVLDSAMGYIMERVDMVLVGAEGVVENGGVVNKVGTYALGVLAKELGVPFYVAAESYKFTRLYPLNNADLPDMGDSGKSGGIGIGSSLRFLDTLAWSANTTSSASPARRMAARRR
jgi:translation initiation factor eIF-2B subunit alpha